MFFFCFRNENSKLEQILIPDHNALDKKGKIFCVTTHLETKSLKTVSNINMIMIYCRDKELYKRLHVLVADIIRIIKKKTLDLISLVQRMHFLKDAFQMNAKTLVPVINHYHINGLHFF